MKREKIKAEVVLEWLTSHFPALAEKVEQERDWVWLAADLRGEENKATRDAIKEYGFRFAKKGHPLPSGREGTWAHACTRPLPFKRKGKPGQPEKTPEEILAEKLEAMG